MMNIPLITEKKGVALHKNLTYTREAEHQNTGSGAQKFPETLVALASKFPCGGPTNLQHNYFSPKPHTYKTVYKLTRAKQKASGTRFAPHRPSGAADWKGVS